MSSARPSFSHRRPWLLLSDAAARSLENGKAADRVARDADGPRGKLRSLPGAGDDDDVRQPRLDRAADAGRFPLRLPLRARPAGGGRGRDGRRLRPGLGPHHDRQPPHRARRRQRDGGDLQRPGQPLAAADHRRPAGARPDDPAGQPDQPRRDPHAPPAGQVGLRARPCRGRAARPRPRRPPRRPAAQGPDLRLAADGRLVRRGRRGRRRPARSPARSTGRAAADPEAVRALAERLDAATNPVFVAGPDIDASGGWDAAIAPGRAPAPAGLGDAGDRRRPPRLPREPPATSAASCRRRSARSARPSRATT